MALIHEYVWFVLAGALLIGFGAAWVLRGLKKSPEEQRAIVDRDIALLELQQTKDELDSLFAAQRKWKTQNKAAAVDAADPALKAEVERLQAELAALREQDGERPQAQAEARAPTPSDSGATDEAALRNALIARNEYLEERIHDVELRLHEMAKELADAHAPAVPEETKAEKGATKEAWLANYLTLRSDALQAKLHAVQSGALGESVQRTETDGGDSDAAALDERSEEVARLRWRNRYLESRLAYLDQPAETPAPTRRAPQEKPTPAASETKYVKSPEKRGPIQQAPRQSKPIAQEKPSTPAPAPDRFAARGPRFSSPMSALASAGAAQRATDAPKPTQTLKTQESVKPERPPSVEGAEADDLTRISGLSSSIEQKLNEIGVRSFAQIAEWTPANLAWVDETFGLDGQARREGWISQARQLIS